MYGVTHTHLVHMCWPVLWGFYQMRCSSATFGTYALVGSLKWIMSAQLSRLEAVVVASPKSPALPDITPMASQPQTPAVCLHRWRVPQFALNHPCNSSPPPRGETWRLSPPPPPRGGRPSRAMGGDFKGGEGTLSLVEPRLNFCLHLHLGSVSVCLSFCCSILVLCFCKLHGQTHAKPFEHPLLNSILNTGVMNCFHSQIVFASRLCCVFAFSACLGLQPSPSNTGQNDVSLKLV